MMHQAGGKESKLYREKSLDYCLNKGYHKTIAEAWRKYGQGYPENISVDEKIKILNSENPSAFYINKYENLVVEYDEVIDVTLGSDDDDYYSFFFMFRISQLNHLDIDKFLDFHLSKSFNNDEKKMVRFLTLTRRDHKDLFELPVSIETTIDEWIQNLSKDEITKNNKDLSFKILFTSKYEMKYDEVKKILEREGFIRGGTWIDADGYKLQIIALCEALKAKKYLNRYIRASELRDAICKEFNIEIDPTIKNYFKPSYFKASKKSDELKNMVKIKEHFETLL
ncbi:MAG: hypothetical protein K2X86_18400 [Cytophagaceae bacterium]|nr:hypothetical protein [Cytophagaceae bacterium]